MSVSWVLIKDSALFVSPVMITVAKSVGLGVMSDHSGVPNNSHFKLLNLMSILTNLFNSSGSIDGACTVVAPLVALLVWL